MRKRIVVTGRVQGVFFRDTCRQVAGRHGVSGWVANRSDGTVEAELEGPADAVDAVVAWAHEGPDSAVVSDVAVTEIGETGAPGFEIR